MSDRPRTRRRAVSYIDKSREYYAAHGYARPYAWASYDDVPFVKWSERNVDLGDARIGVVTTAFPTDFTAPKRVQWLPTDVVPDALFTQDRSWDKDATHTDDVGSFLPLAALRMLADSGTIGEVGRRFFCIPTEYSQRRTHDDAAQIVKWAIEDELDAVLLVPL